MNGCRVPSLFVVLFCFFCSHAASRAQQAAPAATGGGDDLQKATQNPVASLISVPIQSNSNFGIGPYDRMQNVLNIQPVIPMKVSDCCNLIIRWIAPIIYQPAPGTANLEVYGINENTPAFFAAQAVQANAGVSGFGDMTPTFFLSPAKPHKLILGVGPVFVLPTATNKVLGRGNSALDHPSWFWCNRETGQSVRW
jgi:hypothetical protein